MKRLILLGGTMGVGKTAICRHLYQALPNCVWLDGDWCWMMHPFVANEENKAMVLHNITALLRAFLANSSLQTILFDWVLHEQSIWDDLLTRLPLEGVEVVEVALTCSPDCLRQHFAADNRDMARVEASIARLPLYQKLRAHKLDITGLSPEQSAQRLLAWLRQRG